jgi:hypothetical protein
MQPLLRRRALVVLASLSIGALFEPQMAAAQLPRSPVDRVDDVSGYQVKVVYALPSDGVDRALDTNGGLAGSVAVWQQWLVEQAGRGLRLDQYQGQLDIQFVRLSRTDAQLRSHGVYLRDQLEYELAGAGLLVPNKIYAMYYDGSTDVGCGGAPWPPDLFGQVTALYLGGAPPGAPSCGSNPFARPPAEPGYLEFAMLHEVLHALGMVPSDAPNHVTSHVSQDPRDIMYAGALPWQPSMLDVNHDDYFMHGVAGRLDLNASAFLLSPIPGATPPPQWPVPNAFPVACDLEPTLRSTPSPDVAWLTFINATGSVRRLWRLDVFGERNSELVLAPWATFRALTNTGDVWVVTEANPPFQPCTAIYRPPASLNSRAVLRVESRKGGDFNRDGHPDSVWQHTATGQVTVEYKGGAFGTESLGWSWLSQLNLGGSGWNVVATADIDSDRRPDLIWQHETTRQVSVWYMGGASGDVYRGWAWLSELNLAGTGWRLSAVADLNVDGHPDLIWQNEVTRQVSVWYMAGASGTTWSSWSWIAESGPVGWKVVAVADLDGNGRPDLVWQNDVVPQVSIWYMGGSDGSTFLRWSWLTENALPGYTVRGMRDYNADGHPDVVWQNDATQQVVVSYLTGAQGNVSAGAGWLAESGVTGWRMIAR